jgi:hypothetical protein
MISQPQHFLYPLNPKSGYLLTNSTDSLPTSKQNFFDMLNFRELSEFGISKNAGRINEGDFIWVHFAAPESAIGAVGRVTETASWSSELNRFTIKIKWDKALSRKLQNQPIPLSAYKQIPYYSAVAANAHTTRILTIWMNGKVSSASVKEESDVQFRLAEVKQRVGQLEFRTELLRAYRGTCAVTGCTVNEVLQAAHIRPVKENGRHTVVNGILLRADFHNLFDRGLLTINQRYEIVLDKSLMKSVEYRRFHGKRLVAIPTSPSDRPSKRLLAEHRNFFASDR